MEYPMRILVGHRAFNGSVVAGEKVRCQVLGCINKGRVEVEFLGIPHPVIMCLHCLQSWGEGRSKQELTWVSSH